MGRHTFKMVSMMSFHTEKCCRLMSAHAASARRLCSSIRHSYYLLFFKRRYAKNL